MVLAETTDGEAPITYLHGLGLVAQSDGTDTEYFERDGLGSVRQLTDELGVVLYTQTFDPYGTPYLSAGSDPSSFGYAGEQTDSNGLIFLRARYYAPGMGRFLNTDPSRLEMNPYQYAASNPVMYVDPSGLVTICEPLLVAQRYDLYEVCIVAEVSVETVVATTSEAVTTQFIDPSIAILILLFTTCEDEIDTGLSTFSTGMQFSVEQMNAGINYDFEILAYLLAGGDTNDLPDSDIYPGIEEWLAHNPEQIAGTVFDEYLSVEDEEVVIYRGSDRKNPSPADVALKRERDYAGYSLSFSLVPTSQANNIMFSTRSLENSGFHWENDRGMHVRVWVDEPQWTNWYTHERNRADSRNPQEIEHHTLTYTLWDLRLNYR